MNYFFSILVVATLIIFLFNKTRRTSIIIMLFILLTLLTIYPKESINAAAEGINLWIFTVMPSLFPFFIISDLLISLKVPENIARLFTPVAKFLFNTSGYGAYVFIMSIFSGYPTGAKITSELIKDNKITPIEGQKILTFSSTSGPLFIIGAIGAGMLKNIAAGYIIFISHIMGAIINGMILKYFSISKNHFNEAANNTLLINDKKTTDNIMSNAIGNSLYTSGFIGAYIILFSVIIALLDKITFFSATSKFFSMLMPSNISWLPGVLIKASLEISNGCKIISSLPNAYELRLILLCFIISFSGFSIIGQVASIISRTGINLKIYIFTKISHGVISCLLCYIFLKIDLLQITTSNTTSFNILNYNIFLIQLLLCIMLLLNIIYIIYKKLRK